MINIDLVTIIIIYNTSLFSGAIAFIYLHRHTIDTSGLKLLASAYVCLGIGSFISGLGEFSIFPLFLWANISFILGIIAYSLLFAGFVSLNHKRHKMVFQVMVVLLILELLLALFTRIWHVDRIRASLFHLLAAASLFASGLTTLSGNRFEKLSAQRYLALCLIVGGTMFFITMLILIIKKVYLTQVALDFAFQIFINFLITIFTYALVKERVERQLQTLSLHDPLTGVGNRRWIESNKPARLKTNDSIIMIDLDHFKAINDTYGHPFGDFVLLTVAERVESILRKDSLFARYGGEEFLTFTPNVSREKILEIGERIRREVETLTFPEMNPDLKITLSAGICLNDGKVESFEKMIHIADQALYRAKKEGRNRVVLGRNN